MHDGFSLLHISQANHQVPDIFDQPHQSCSFVGCWYKQPKLGCIMMSENNHSTSKQPSLKQEADF